MSCKIKIKATATSQLPPAPASETADATDRHSGNNQKRINTIWYGLWTLWTDATTNSQWLNWDTMRCNLMIKARVTGQLPPAPASETADATDRRLDKFHATDRSRQQLGNIRSCLSIPHWSNAACWNSAARSGRHQSTQG